MQWFGQLCLMTTIAASALPIFVLALVFMNFGLDQICVFVWLRNYFEFYFSNYFLVCISLSWDRYLENAAPFLWPDLTKV